MPEETEAEPEPDLTPIPLVDVDEPMVLEGPAYSAAKNTAERTESQTGTAPTVEPSAVPRPPARRAVRTRSRR